MKQNLYLVKCASKSSGSIKTLDVYVVADNETKAPKAVMEFLSDTLKPLEAASLEVSKVEVCQPIP